MGLVPNAEFIGGWALFNYYQMNEQPYWMLKTLDSLYKRWPTNGLISRSYAAQLSAVGALPQALSIMNGIHGPTREDDFRMLELNRRLGRDQDALKIAHSMEKKYPQARGINAIISDIHLAKGENDKAILYALNELALDKENIICINNLAWIHGVINHDLAKAQPYLKRLEEMKNGDPRVLDTIGWILANSEQGPEAESYFKLALNISPNNPTLLYHFAWQQYKHGDKAKAADLVTKALALNRPFTEKSEAQKLLADLN
jgi:tetratricopeptide (TPR) repeat protein